MPCLESTPSTRHVLALFNTIDSAWVYSTPSAQCCLALFNAFDTAQLGVLVNDYNMACTAFDMAWLGLFDAFDAARRGFDRHLTHGAVNPLIFCCRHNNPPAARLSKQHVTSNFSRTTRETKLLPTCSLTHLLFARRLRGLSMGMERGIW